MTTTTASARVVAAGIQAFERLRSARRENWTFWGKESASLLDTVLASQAHTLMELEKYMYWWPLSMLLVVLRDARAPRSSRLQAWLLLRKNEQLKHWGFLWDHVRPLFLIHEDAYKEDYTYFLRCVSSCDQLFENNAFLARLIWQEAVAQGLEHRLSAVFILGLPLDLIQNICMDKRWGDYYIYWLHHGLGLDFFKEHFWTAPLSPLSRSIILTDTSNEKALEWLAQTIEDEQYAYHLCLNVHVSSTQLLALWRKFPILEKKVPHLLERLPRPYSYAASIRGIQEYLMCPPA